MQTTYPSSMTFADAVKAGQVRKEVFTGATDEEVQAKMDTRLKELERTGQGEVLAQRKQITDLPLEIRDLAAECATAGNRGQRKRLRKELHKLVDAL